MSKLIDNHLSSFYSLDVIKMKTRQEINKKYVDSDNGKLVRRNYRNSKKGKLVHKIANKKWRKSKSGVSYMERGHKLMDSIHYLKYYYNTPMENCAICNSPNTEFHHPNNKLPLHIYFLCKKHHGEQHG